MRTLKPGPSLNPAGRWAEGLEVTLQRDQWALASHSRRSAGEKQEERVTFWVMTVENCQEAEGGANSRDWGIYGNQPSELGTSVSHVPSLWYW